MCASEGSTEMEPLTILTPTYNRATCLPKLYHSLKKQSEKRFVWMIVDDGSEDETAALVREWIEEGEIPIRWMPSK